MLGDDLLVVSASCRGDQARWSARRVQGFLAEQGGAAESIDAGPNAGVTLAWPSHRTLRRDVALGEQTLESLRESVAEAPDAFFPVSRDEGLLWDAHEFVGDDGARRALLCAIRLRDIEVLLDRLASAGLTPTRIVPSAACWSAMRFVFDDAPQRVLEKGPGGWSVAEFEGLRWTGLRAGFGAPPADATGDAAVCDWGATPQGVGESGAFRPESMHAEHAALGAALLDLVRVDPNDAGEAPSIDLLRGRPRRVLRMTPLAWFTAASAALVVSLLALNGALEKRAADRADLLAAEIARLRPAMERVEAMRERNAAVVAAHDRLVTIESNFRPMTTTLAELTRVTPAGASFDKIDFADSGMTVRAISTATSELMGAIEASPLFVRVLPMGGRTVAPGGIETADLGFNFETPPPAFGQGAGEGATR